MFNIALATASDRRGRALITTRIGMSFLAASVFLMICAVIVNQLPEKPLLHRLLWIAATAVCSLGGLISMRSARALRTIESELTRCVGAASELRNARRILSSDPVTDGWNGLLDEVARSAESATQRQPATLEHEAVTLARAMRGLPVAWVITDAEARIRFLAPAACGLLGLDDDESHTGKDLPELLGLRVAANDAEDPSSTEKQEQLLQLLSNVRMVQQRQSLCLGDRTLQFRITRSRLTGRSGDGEGMAWVLADITQQQIASKARDEFLMTATHELRTPLANLQAYAEALGDEDGSDIEQQKEFCNIITAEATRLSRLVDQLLSVGQMEAGSMVAARHELDLHPMVQHVEEQVRGQAEQKRMNLIMDVPPKLPTIFGDRDKLQAALVNLVGNAIKYTPECGEVVVRCQAEDRWICVEVQDNGPGIPEEEQTRVFDKFYRCASAQQSEQRGNGMGLAFAREIARIHSGEIELTSKPGEGSTFRFRLPIGGQSRSGV